MPPPFYHVGHTFNNLTCSCRRCVQVLQIRNMPHAVRNNKRKRESDRKGHDQLHKSVCWGRAFYISHSAPKLKTQTNTYFMYTKDYYFIFVISVCMWKRGMGNIILFLLFLFLSLFFFLFMWNLLFSAFSKELLIRDENYICSNLWIHII